MKNNGKKHFIFFFENRKVVKIELVLIAELNTDNSKTDLVLCGHLNLL